ncbi:MAG: hypothetical protein ABSB60_03225 [Terracidiphilus sp.]|jgi:hypothetical protein
MTENIVFSAVKKFDSINLEELSGVLATTLQSQLGGIPEVSVTKLEHTKPGESDNGLVLQFLVKEGSLEAQISRWMARSSEQSAEPVSPA